LNTGTLASQLDLDHRVIWKYRLSSSYLKGPDHRILGWKVLINKYNVDMSLSEERWCWMSDSLNIMTIYFKRSNMHTNWGKFFFCPMDKKMIPPNIEWCIWRSPGLCTIFLKTSTVYLKFMLYHAVVKILLDNLKFFHLYAQTVLRGL